MWIAAVIAILLFPLVRVSAQTSQDDSGWSKPVVLFDQPGLIDSPVIVADRTGRLHVFWRLVHEFSGNEAIYYLRSDPIQGDASVSGIRWSAPALLQLRKQLGPPSAVVDDAGEIHLVFHSTNQSIWYTHASTDLAEDQGSWSVPVQVGRGQPGVQIALGPGSRLYLVYGADKDGGVVLQTSPDSGATWSAPQVIAPPYHPQDLVDDLRIAVESERVLHLAWSEFSGAGNRPAGVYYTRTVDGGSTWSETFQLAPSGYTQVNLAYSSATGELHAAWNGSGGVKGRFYRRSPNAGYLWQDTEEVSPVGTGGAEGLPQMVVDAGGALSLLTTEAGCAWYLARADAWSSPFCFYQAETIAQPGLALLNGRLLAAVFQEENQSYYRLDFSLQPVSAPEVAPRPFENVLAAPAASATPQPSPSFTTLPPPPEGLASTSTETHTPVASPTRAAPTLFTSPTASPTRTDLPATATPGSPAETPVEMPLSVVGAAQLTPSAQAEEASSDHLVETLVIPNTGAAKSQPMDISQIILISLAPTLLGLGILIGSRLLRRNRPDY